MNRSPESAAQIPAALGPVATIRILVPGDEPALDRFLSGRVESSMILLSNLRMAGLVDRGEPYQGTYIAGFDEAGEVAGVVCRYWNGNFVYQAPAATAKLAREAAALIGKPIAGLLGPYDQTLAICTALGLDSAPTTTEKCEDFFDLKLSELNVPPLLESGEVTCRPSRVDDLPLLAEWDWQFHCEVMGGRDDAKERQSSRDAVERWHSIHAQWVLEAAGRTVATSRFNASLRDCVQVGGVWTPPELRRRGYARCAVAGSLLAARSAGATRAILFADDPHAQRAYRALGFKRIGDYGIVLFDGPQEVNLRMTQSSIETTRDG